MKNYFLGFLSATIIFLIVTGYFFYPVYQKYQQYERARVAVVVKGEKLKEATTNKLQSWRDKLPRKKEEK